jgi:hypothetical protein
MERMKSIALIALTLILVGGGVFQFGAWSEKHKNQMDAQKKLDAAYQRIINDLDQIRMDAEEGSKNNQQVMFMDMMGIAHGSSQLYSDSLLLSRLGEEAYGIRFSKLESLTLKLSDDFYETSRLPGRKDDLELMIRTINDTTKQMRKYKLSTKDDAKKVSKIDFSS